MYMVTVHGSQALESGEIGDPLTENEPLLRTWGGEDR